MNWLKNLKCHLFHRWRVTKIEILSDNLDPYPVARWSYECAKCNEEWTVLK